MGVLAHHTGHLSIDIFHDNHGQSSQVGEIKIRVLSGTVGSIVCVCEEAVRFGVITFNKFDHDVSTRLLSIFSFGGGQEYGPRGASRSFRLEEGLVRECDDMLSTSLEARMPVDRVASVIQRERIDVDFVSSTLSREINLIERVYE